MRINRILSFFVAAILLSACSNQDEEFLSNVVKNSLEERYLVSEKEAINEAISFFNAQGINIRNDKRLGVKKRNMISPTSSETKKQEGVYIINFENNGYAVVSADKRDGATIYLASLNGSFDENDSDNQYLLSIIKNYQESAISTNSFNPDKGDVVQTETTIVEENYGPLLNTRWHQNYPYNNELITIYSIPDTLKNNYHMGCVPVAIGQIINYYQYPNAINGEIIDWELISWATGLEYSSNTATNAASRLLYLIGTGMDINYPNSFGATFNDAVSEFHRLGYSLNTQNGYNKSVIKSQVASNKPVFMCGYNESDGHAWVADGYMKVRVLYRMYDENGNLVENTVLNEYNYDNVYEYIHLNVGWKTSTPFYQMTSMEYSSDMDYRVWAYSDIFNFGSGSNVQSFNDGVKMIYNFSINN